MTEFKLFGQLFFKHLTIESKVQVSDTTGLPKVLSPVNKKIKLCL